FQNLLDLAFHALERTIANADAITLVERRLLVLLLAAFAARMVRLFAKNLGYFRIRHGRRVMFGTASNKITHARGISKEIENPVVVFSLCHQITRIKLLFPGVTLAVLHLGHTLNRDDDLTVEFFQSFDLDLALNGFLDRILSTTLDLDDIP